MRKFMGALLCLVVSVLSVFIPSVTPVAGATAAVRSVVVTGSGAAMYPDFDPTVTRYALTTDAATAGTVRVDATTSDPAGTVYVDGAVAAGPTDVTGLTAGDEVSVIIDDSSGRTAYSVIYLPTDFPKISVTTNSAGVQPGLIALTLNTFEQNPLPAYDTIIDRNGVPVYAVAAARQDLDLKQQPDGSITVQRPTTDPAHTGVDMVTLDGGLAESARTHVEGTLVNTDGHDAQRLPDGSTLLLGYEPNAVTGKTDATIQKLDPLGTPVFTWNSSALADETVAGSNPDYAHVNSIQSIENGDVLVSFRHLSAVLRIAMVAHDGYQPGDIIWKLGGRDSSFTFVNDPYGGPCAQHAASELANGDILLYDNGTNGFCVDPADRGGPTINRGQTRVAEYALDTTTHTATLVWDYTPLGKYASFAGSARRMGNGDTLIGWADDRNALATEITSDKQVLWEVTAPPALPGHSRYMSYRASLITDLTDKIKPVVLPSGPADGARFTVGDMATAGARCTDRGGSNLATCAVTGATGGLLDTATAGTRSWAVTATDGAGNTTTVTRSYTVVPPVRSADATVRKDGSTTWATTVHQATRRGQNGTSYWLVRNGGNRADSFALRGTAGTTRFVVHYWSAGRDVTAAVLAGSFRTVRLAPGQSQVVRVVVRPTYRAPRGVVRAFTLRSIPAGSGAGDQVVVREKALF
ncbi:MAG: Arylsulfotransferase [Marmoricola sp.]|nr:Arylsulfotransferase [Marmoricola sp.]